MADRFAVASGPWSDPATWDGGLDLPGPEDTAHLNDAWVELDTSIAVATLRNDFDYPGSVGAGGRVTVGFPTDPAGPVSITLGSIICDPGKVGVFISSIVGVDVSLTATSQLSCESSVYIADPRD